ncbi:hypothetical protein AGMMS49545_23830 [Betaproteobacteria bacterium]|nr:hypothetical protein AGMMS49545_23830 [Betaproteobacteria bacterium]GHU49337.1 hypothetical protein AGMMS50289_26390 [Betaproteobacteria bacterium]
MTGKNLDRSTTGTDHYNASQVQNTATTGGTLGSETVIAYKALRAANLDPKVSKCAVLKARGYLAGLGANAGTVTNIPKQRRK